MHEYLEQRRVGCPYCGENFTIEIDRSAGGQSYVEDCQVCCRPLLIEFALDNDGEITDLTIKREDE